MNESDLLDALNQTMPFGPFCLRESKGRKLIDLPEPYLVWFHREGFPNNKLGWPRSLPAILRHFLHPWRSQLALVYEIKLNGLEAMVKAPRSPR